MNNHDEDAGRKCRESSKSDGVCTPTYLLGLQPFQPRLCLLLPQDDERSTVLVKHQGHVAILFLFFPNGNYFFERYSIFLAAPAAPCVNGYTNFALYSKKHNGPWVLNMSSHNEIRGSPSRPGCAWDVTPTEKKWKKKEERKEERGVMANDVMILFAHSSTLVMSDQPPGTGTLSISSFTSDMPCFSSAHDASLIHYTREDRGSSRTCLSPHFAGQSPTKVLPHTYSKTIITKLDDIPRVAKSLACSY